MRLFGTDDNEVFAAKIDRTPDAVQCKHQLTWQRYDLRVAVAAKLRDFRRFNSFVRDLTGHTCDIASKTARLLVGPKLINWWNANARKVWRHVHFWMGFGVVGDANIIITVKVDGEEQKHTLITHYERFSFFFHPLTHPPGTW